MSLGIEIRSGARLLKRYPGFTVMVSLVMGLAISSSVLIFQLTEFVLLQPLPVTNPHSLILFKWNSSQDLPPVLRSLWSGYDEHLSFPYAAYRKFSEQRGSVRIFGFAAINSSSVKINNLHITAQGEAVTDSYFGGLGLQPQMGRLLDEQDAGKGSFPAIVISNSFWVRAFGGSRTAVGQSLVFHHVPFTIVGITPQNFTGLEPGQAVDFWVPLSHWAETQELLSDNTDWGLTLMGRLQLGANVNQVRSELNESFQSLFISAFGKNPHPGSLPTLTFVNGNRGVDLVGRRFSQPTMGLVLLGGLVFIISCANIALLILNRAFTRKMDLAIRVSLGAPRTSLVRQSIIESVLLATLGLIVGVMVIACVLRPLSSRLEALAPFIGLNLSLISPNLTVGCFAAGLTAIAGIACGLIPALYISGRATAGALRSQGSSQGAVPNLHIREAVLVLQTALSVVLVIVAGLMVKTLENLQHQNLGFDPHHLILFSVNAYDQGYSGASLSDIYGRIQRRLQDIPGTESASSSSTTLGSTSALLMPISIPGRTSVTQSQPDVAIYELVGPNFFQTMGMPLLQGRDVKWGDMGDAKPVAVISEVMARKFFPNQNVIGRTFTLGGMFQFEVVGLVGETRGHSLRGDAFPRVYLPYSAMSIVMPTLPDGMFFQLRTMADSGLMINSIRAVIAGIDRNLVLMNVGTQIQQVSDAVIPERLLAELSSVFALLVLLLTSVSIYAVQANAVIQRTREIGIRLSLGSTRSAILWLIAGRNLGVILPGALFGLLLSVGVTRLFVSQLYDVKAVSLVTDISAVFVLVFASMLGSLIPAIRAASLDPQQALRYE